MESFAPVPAPTTTDAAAPATGRRSTSFAAVVAIEAAVAVAVRVAYTLVLGRHLKLGLDAIWYLLVGGSLAAGRGYSDPALLYGHGIERATANFVPGYPYFLAGLDKLGITTPMGFQLAGAVAGGVTVVLTALLGRRLTGRPAVGLVAAGLVALLPTLVASDASIMSETLAVPLTVAVLLAAAWAARSASLWRWAAVGLLAGLLALVRTEDLLVAVALVPLAALVAPGKGIGRRLGQMAVALGVVAVVLAPWVVRNETTFTPSVLLSTNDGKTLAGSNCPSTYSGPLLGYWADACVGHAQLEQANEAAADQALRSDGARYARAHLTRVPLVVAVRVLRAWGLYAPVQQAHLQALQTRSARWQLFAWPFSLLLLLVAIPGIVLVRRDRLALVLLAGPAVLATFVVAASFGNPRYVLSATPSLCVAAAVSVVAIADGRRPARHRGGA